jgi:hypothetical protein
MAKPWKHKGKRDWLSETFWFGQYVGENIGRIAESDPDYIRFLLYKSEMQLDREMVEALELTLEAHEGEAEWDEDDNDPLGRRASRAF